MSKHSKKDDISLNEKNFMLKAMDEGLRADGRGLYDFRNLTVSFGENHGQVMIELGRTKVFVTTSCEICEPLPDKPSEGFFVFNIQFSPISALKYEHGRTGPSAIELSNCIERGLRESRAIDAEALCIVSEEKVWSIRFDIRILDDCGNLVDCCSIAAITALHHARRPDITINNGEVTVHPFWERDPVPLSIHHMPIGVTFGILQIEKDRQILFVDPTHLEESVIAGKMTFTLNIHREICGLHKAGGFPLAPKDIVLASKIAMIKVQELTNAIQSALADDSIKRKNVKAKPIQENSAFDMKTMKK
jgi:exosome complex component RRP45